MSGQTVYQNDFDLLRAGDVALGSGKQDSVSMLAEVAIEFGLGVVRGASPEIQVKVPTADTQIFAGVAGFIQNEDGVYAIDDTVKVYTSGRISVPVPSAVTVIAGETAYVVASGGDAGKFTNVALDNIAISGTFISAKKNDNLAIIELN